MSKRLALSKKWKIAALIVACWCGSLIEANAWGRRGHAVVAKIASDHLSEHAKSKVIKLLALEGAGSLDEISSWADSPIAKRRHNRPKHTVRLSMSDAPFDAARDCPQNRCVTVAIEKYSNILADPMIDDQNKLEALKYVVHFIGDVHQPLHSVANTGDQPVIFLGKKMSLHKVWDTGIIRAGKVTYKSVPRSFRNETIAINTPMQWALESREIALEQVYAEIPPAQKSSPVVTLSNDYVERYKPFVERRLLQAGRRLAEVLNKALVD